ncbi:hypothetical protein Pelo_7319 [Pelomyxa schiedti]|nr:hypothetical protein Pelo_7319 [Pelomyxa schiedti]
MFGVETRSLVLLGVTVVICVIGLEVGQVPVDNAGFAGCIVFNRVTAILQPETEIEVGQRDNLEHDRYKERVCGCACEGACEVTTSTNSDTAAHLTRPGDVETVILPNMDENMCTSPEDTERIEELRKSGKFHDVASHCGRMCRRKQDIAECAGRCLQDSTGISQGCASCFAADIQCALKHCKMACWRSSESKKCIACHNKYCTPALQTCTGLPPPPIILVPLEEWEAGETDDSE